MMIVEALTPSSVIALRPLEVLFKKAQDFDSIERYVKAIVKRYPKWQIGWFNLSSKELIIVIHIPLHTLQDPWAGPLMKVEEYKLSFSSPIPEK